MGSVPQAGGDVHAERASQEAWAHRRSGDILYSGDGDVPAERTEGRGSGLAIQQFREGLLIIVTMQHLLKDGCFHERKRGGSKATSIVLAYSNAFIYFLSGNLMHGRPGVRP
jgi:hypothetical protein